MRCLRLQTLGTKFDIVVLSVCSITSSIRSMHWSKSHRFVRRRCIFNRPSRAEGRFEPQDDYPSEEIAAFLQPAWPKLYFIEKNFNGDVSNWWFATRSCLKAMVRTSGFRKIEETTNSEFLSAENRNSHKEAQNLVNCVVGFFVATAYSLTGSRRTFFRLRLRASACLIRFLSPGFR